MTSKKKEKGPFERVVDAISDFMGQPLSDESYEVVKKETVKKAKAAATGKKKRAPKKKRASKARKSKKA